MLLVFMTMASKGVILLCYWGGSICDGPEGVSYNKPPSKAINVQRGIKFNELINQIHVATSIDKQKNCIEVICRYPSGFGKMMKYIPLPITDNNDIEIMFQILNVYQELSTIDIYLEVETQRHSKIARRCILILILASLLSFISNSINYTVFFCYTTCRTQEPSMTENDASLPSELSNERTNELLPTDLLYDDFNIQAKIAHTYILVTYFSFLNKYSVSIFFPLYINPFITLLAELKDHV